MSDTSHIQTSLKKIDDDIKFLNKLIRENEESIERLNRQNDTLHLEQQRLYFYQFFRSRELTSLIKSNNDEIMKLDKQNKRIQKEVDNNLNYSEFLKTSQQKTNQQLKRINKYQNQEFEKKDYDEFLTSFINKSKEEQTKEVNTFMDNAVKLGDIDATITYEISEEDDGFSHQITFTFNEESPYIDKLLDAIHDDIQSRLESNLNSNEGRGIKIESYISYKLFTNNGEEQEKQYNPITVFNKPYQANSLSEIDFTTMKNEMKTKIFHRVLKAVLHSGYSIRSYPSISFYIHKTNRLHLAGSYIPTPKYLKNFIRNIKFEDEKCLEHALVYLLNKDKLIKMSDVRMKSKFTNDSSLIQPILTNIPQPFPFNLDVRHRDKTFALFSKIEEMNKFNLQVFIPLENLEFKNESQLQPTQANKPSIMCVYSSKLIYPTTLHLMVLSNEEEIYNDSLTYKELKTITPTYHFCPISNVERLFGVSKEDTNRKEKVCIICSKSFKNTFEYENHLNYCLTDLKKNQVISFPDGKFGNDYKKFTRYDAFMSPFAYITFDTEASMINERSESVDVRLLRKNNERMEQNKTKTKMIYKHNCNSIGYLIHSDYDTSINELNIIHAKSDTENPCETFVRKLFDIQPTLIHKVSTNHEIDMSEESVANHNQSEVCCFCGGKFVSDKENKFYKYLQKVRHHNHYLPTNNYIGAGHSCCNIKAHKIKQIPILCHNLSYDFMYMMKAIFNVLKEPKYMKLKEELKRNERSKRSEHFESNERSESNVEDSLLQKQFDFNVKNKSANDIITFSLGIYKFVDTLRFLDSSLLKIVESNKKSNNTFTNTTKYMKKMFMNDKDCDEMLNMCYMKGVYPYEWFDTVNKFNEPCIPPIECFSSTLKNENITKDEYNRALKVQEKFKCKTFRDYHDIYLYLDVLLLSDVFTNYRNESINAYMIDPINFISGSSYSFEAMLLKAKRDYFTPNYKKEGIKLFSSREIYEDVEQAIRGGISYIAKRYAKANNKYCPDYDATKPISYLLGLDVNQLYPTILQGNLPLECGDYILDEELEDFKEKWKTKKTSGDNNYLVCCDIDIPKELHDKFDKFPLCAQHKDDTPQSKYCEKIYETLNSGANNTFKSVKCNKLICDLTPKRNHWEILEYLQFCNKQGYIITNISKVIKFKQGDYMRTFIEYNAQQRKLASQSNNKFKETLYKNNNNSIYGKTIQNETNYSKSKIIVDDKKKYRKEVGKASFQSSTKIGNGCYILQHSSLEVKITVPKLVGAYVLGKSKLIVQEFYYDVLMKENYKINGGVDNSLFNDVRLLFTDTDSIYVQLYLRGSDDVKMFINKYHSYLDLSKITNPDYKDLLSNENEAKFGKFKIEEGAEHIVEFVGLRAKLYSKKMLNKDCIKLKGINNLNGITHESFKSCLLECNKLIQDKSFDKDKVIQRQDCSNILAKVFNNYTVRTSKISLCSCDDKRYVLMKDEDPSIEFNGSDSLAFGHYKLKQLI
jgi:hypothetical protein